MKETFVVMRRKDLMPIACHVTMDAASAHVAALIKEAALGSNPMDAAMFVVRVVTNWPVAVK